MATRYRGLTLGGLLILLVLAGAAFYLYLHFRPAEGADFELKFSATDILGRPISTDSFRGNVLLVNVFSTTCPPCVRETPELVKLYNERHGDGLDILMVSVGPPDRLADFSVQHKIPYPIIADGLPIADQVPNLRGIPTTIILDRKGIVRHRIVGADVLRIRKTVDDLLAEK
jgi:peroxiredoxin